MIEQRIYVYNEVGDCVDTVDFSTRQWKILQEKDATIAALTERVKELEGENKSMEDHIHKVGNMYADLKDRIRELEEALERIATFGKGKNITSWCSTLIEVQSIARKFVEVKDEL
jgi:predicted nuclease with TOPRIM domain